MFHHSDRVFHRSERICRGATACHSRSLQRHDVGKQDVLLLRYVRGHLVSDPFEEFGDVAELRVQLTMYVRNLPGMRQQRWNRPPYELVMVRTDVRDQRPQIPGIESRPPATDVAVTCAISRRTWPTPTPRPVHASSIDRFPLQQKSIPWR